MSHSAPCVSEKDEKLEIARLSEEERDAIIADLYGQNIARRNSNHESNNNENGAQEQEQQANHDNDVDNNDLVVNNNNGGDDNDDDISADLLHQFDLSFMDIPYETSINYYHAGLHAPLHVLENECNRMHFLRKAQYDPRIAAQKMCEYWNVRVANFGKEHAFKPMTLDGAMEHVIPELILLPNLVRILPDDDHGRTVVCWDRTNVAFKDFDSGLLAKLMFWICHLAFQKETRTGLNKGIVFLVINKTSLWDFPPRSLVRAVVDITLCYPVKTCSVHFCYSSLVLQFVLPFMKSLLSSHTRQRVRVHSKIDKYTTILNELKSYGLQKDHLPKSIGGNYTEKQPWIIEAEHRMMIAEKQRRRTKRDRSNLP